MFVEAASAAFLWLLRDKKTELKFDNFELPFKDCKATRELLVSAVWSHSDF
jgi:hypothetical protein